MEGTRQPGQPEDADTPYVLRKLMAEKGMSNRKLAAATKEIDGRGLGASSIGNIARGDDRASPEALAMLAQALDVQPDAFAEYRLAKAREMLDERVVGLDAALANLNRVERALRGAAAARPARRTKPPGRNRLPTRVVLPGARRLREAGPPADA